MRRLKYVSAGLVGLGLFAVLTSPSGQTKFGQLANEALAEGDFPAACLFADQAWELHPGDVRSILVGAEAAEENGELQRAVDFLARLPPTVQEPGVYTGWLKLADLQIRLGQFTPARTTYETILEYVPDDPNACRRLARLLSGCGYRFESLPFLRRLVATNEADSADLVRLALNGTMLFGLQQLERAHQLCPNDPMAIVGLIEHDRNDRDVVARRSLMKQAQALASQSIPLRIQVLEFRLETAANEHSDTGDIATGLLELLASADARPDPWRLAAQWAQQQRLPQLRLRCLVESVVRDRWNTACLHALSGALRGDARFDGEVAKRAQLLSRIQETTHRIFATKYVTSDVEFLAVGLHSIGRFSEAEAWARIALRDDPASDWAGLMISGRASSVNRGATQTLGTFPMKMLREVAAELPLPHEVMRREVPSMPQGNSEIRFVDTSSSAGIRFIYNNGAAADQEGLRMHQWTGGGVGVVDIDADGWPDLYFSKGVGVVGANNTSTATTGVYRNLRGKVFDDVTGRANLAVTSFGQGVAIGDINNDGFDDVYVASTGGNTLHINQGDGTFQQLTGFHGSTGWTTSVAIADLNGDSYPDIYDVNYIGGPHAFLQTCDHEGRRRTCGPTDFPAEPDCVFYSDGSGGFRNVTSESGFDVSPGRGMGVIVGDVLGGGSNQVFVTNDETENLFFTRSGDSANFTESGFVLGTAYDQYGSAQGSMGIAVGDIDGNHCPDLFVTNYYAESNTLYAQQHATGFVDDTAAADLAISGYSMLGFGCQFFDADADGDSDLFVTNGHLDDFTHVGHPFRMRPQFYENVGSGRMAEVHVAGDYFGSQVLGRSVATLDWNRDGRCDVVVTHLDSTVALLTNETRQINSTISIVLKGTNVARDAIGGSVSWSSAAGPTAWRVAGDGYQCSNERVLRLTTAGVESRKSGLRVTWPGKQSGSVGPVADGTQFGVVENRTSAYELPQ